MKNNSMNKYKRIVITTEYTKASPPGGASQEVYLQQRSCFVLRFVRGLKILADVYVSEKLLFLLQNFIDCKSKQQRLYT